MLTCLQVIKKKERKEEKEDKKREKRKKKKGKKYNRTEQRTGLLNKHAKLRN